VGVEAGYFFLAPRTDHFDLNSPPGVTVGRPFVSLPGGVEDAQLVSVPGLLNGAVSASVTSRLQGAEVNGVVSISDSPVFRSDFLAGFRFLDLEERLGVTEDLVVAPGVPGIGGNAFALADRFHTSDRFYGGQFGVRGELNWGPWSVTTTAKVAFGCTEEVVGIRGSTLITPAGGVTVFQPGGLLAQSSNMGRYSRDAFTVVPEVGINLGFQVSPALRLVAGWTFLYWSDVARPGDQIDRSVSVAQVPVVGVPGGVGTRPSFTFHTTDFWATGLNLGFEFRF
jgi:hypothetical protein